MIKKEILEKIKPGATIAVKEKYGNFKGIVLARKHGNEAGATFTVRSVVGGVGVEKVYPINSPIIKSVRIVSSPKNIHKSKLYFLRKLSEKKIRRKIKKITS